MALTQTQAQIRASVRKCADIEGTSATTRHPDADVDDYVNRGIAALYRLLKQVLPDQRFLLPTTIATANGVSGYALPPDFDRLISIDINANGARTWLTAFEMHERAELSDPNTSYSGVPANYRLRGKSIDLLPTPSGVYTVSLWYVPDALQLSSGQSLDTIDRLDDFVIWYAAREVFTKDRLRDMASDMSARLAEIRGDILVAARSRDMNSTPRIVDDSRADRFGRYGRSPWGR